MSHEQLLAFLAFAFVSSITPGPNNLMLMASGANFGLRRTMPHMLGVGIGFAVMLLLVGAGLSEVFAVVPHASAVLKAVSVCYLLFLAWKIATAAPPEPGQATGRPMTFVGAAAFQWVNPKAWAMALTSVSVYAPTHTLPVIATVAAVFGAVNLPSVSAWTLIGHGMRTLLTKPGRMRAFNVTMSLLLVASLYPILAH